LKCAVLVAAAGMSALMNLKVAGLTLAQRLSHHVKRAGLEGPFFLLDPGPEDGGLQGLPAWARMVRGPEELTSFMAALEDQDRSGVAVLALEAGVLPDIERLSAIAALEAEDRQALTGDGMLYFRVRHAGFDLKELFEPGGMSETKKRLSALAALEEFPPLPGRVYRIRSAMDVPGVVKALFKGLIKEGEGFMSRYVERPISLAISRRLVETSITPNQITLISIAIGLAGAALMAVSKGPPQIAGSLLFLLHSIVDGCDGEIARIKFMESRIGGILDFWGDNLVHSAVFFAIGFEWWLRTGSPLPMTLALAAVLGTLVSAGMVFFTTMVKKEGEGPLYTSVAPEGGQGSLDRRRRLLAAAADYLSRRDFIYLVVILAWFGRLEWFLAASALGTWAFAAVVIYLRMKMGREG